MMVLVNKEWEQIADKITNFSSILSYKVLAT